MLRHTLLLLLAIPATGSCRNSTAPADTLQVSLVASASVVHPVESVVILVTASNRGHTPITIDAPSCPDMFVVLNAAGDIVGPSLRRCAAIAVLVRLGPGEEWTSEYTWAGTGLQERIDDPPLPLPAGDYRLVGMVSGIGVHGVSAPVPIRVE